MGSDRRVFFFIESPSIILNENLRNAVRVALYDLWHRCIPLLFSLSLRHFPTMPQLPHISVASDHSLVLTFGATISKKAHLDVLRAMKFFEDHPRPSILNLHPAYCTVLIDFNPTQTTIDEMISFCEEGLKQFDTIVLPPHRSIEIPVVYGGEFGPDLNDVAAHHHRSTEDVITIHSSENYVVYFLGFSPGFPYMGGLPEQIATPRLAVPRKNVPAGSVAIGGNQTGIYPLATPGGWRIIGRTPLRLFDAKRNPPTLLQMGDRVTFKKLSTEEFRSFSQK